MASAPSSANQFVEPNLPPAYVQKRKAEPDQPGVMKKPCAGETPFTSDVNGLRGDLSFGNTSSFSNTGSFGVRILSSLID